MAQGDGLSDLRLIVITGLSGAGKSTAMRCIEDLGFFCVDNVPPQLVTTFYDLYQQIGTAGPGVAIASDVRSGALFDDLEETVRTLRATGVSFSVVYLDCDTATLIRRFREVRRAHPLQVDGRPVKKAIEEERRRLEPIRAIASHVIDTTELTAGRLRETIVRELAGEDVAGVVRLEFLSFGFKYGVPRDADFVFDVRFLPNPFYVEELEALTGEDERVYEYVMKSELADRFFERAVGLVDLVLEPFAGIGKYRLVVGVGCTGGRHRSVAFAVRLASHFARLGRRSIAAHRDADKPSGAVQQLG